MISGSQDAVHVLVPRAGIDNVGLVREDVPIGRTLFPGDEVIAALAHIPAGHKVAVRRIPAGDPVMKYGGIIGIAERDISPGDHVHDHNVSVGELTSTRPMSPVRPHPWFPEIEPTRSEFCGYHRDDGRVGTRNHIAVVPTVNCSATVARMIADEANARFREIPGFDGVVGLSHELGCGMAENTDGLDILRRTLAGYLRHQNFAASLVVSLGCEVNQPDDLLGAGAAGRATTLRIQELGGTAATVDAGLELIADLVEQLRGSQRAPAPLSALTLGLQCGGSDAHSALTANPTLGVAADLLVAGGGRVILGETPEIHGAEHLLQMRAATPGVAEELGDLIVWWEDYCARNGAQLHSNPSPGNRDGGITTVWEKSLGAVLKAGSSPLNAVVRYADPVLAPGFTFMDTPGYDPVSATGMVAGGANALAFTTGRGSVFGSRPTPCIKISSTSALYERMAGDIDFDAGGALSREQQLERGRSLFEALVDMASGTTTRSEQLGFGSAEIVPWRMGAVL